MFHSEEFQDLEYLDILEINELCLPLSTGGRTYVGRSRKKKGKKGERQTRRLPMPERSETGSKK